MITEDQSGVVALLESPVTHDGAAVERIDTHASMVFLAADRAWKLKRAVRYDYLDYSTAARRREMCEAEVRINRRIAPALYRGVAAVTRQVDGSLTIGGPGTPVDWLVEMARFDQRCLLNRLAEAGVLPIAVMPRLAQVIARFHETAVDRASSGGWEAMRRVIEGNAAGLAAEAAGIVEPRRRARLKERTRFVLDRDDILLDQRRANGFVRQCHGDLHLRNIVMLDGEPTLFDAIEFDDELSWIDVLYDLAFLLMDLGRLGLPHHANVVWNGYLAETGDLEGLALMPLFLSCRAAIVAKTTATSANLQTDPDGRAELQRLASDYFTLAEALLEPAPAQLIAIGGLSGTGKSTLAEALAPSRGAAPGAVVIRSDLIRKRLCGGQPLDRLGPEGYTPEMSRRVYATLMDHAEKVVSSGYTAIADAVFAEPDDRDAIARVARTAGVPFAGLWLEAPKRVLTSRVARRVADASDAGVAVVEEQHAYRLGVQRWDRLDASGTRQQVVDAAVTALAALETNRA